MVSGDGVIQDKHKKEMVRRLLSGVIAVGSFFFMFRSAFQRMPPCEVEQLS